MTRQERYGLVVRQAVAVRRGLRKGKNVLDIVVDGGLLLPGRPGKVGISTNNGWNRGCFGGDREEHRAEKQTVIDTEIPLSKRISALWTSINRNFWMECSRSSGCRQVMDT